jgi:hypothetical protein
VALRELDGAVARLIFEDYSTDQRAERQLWTLHIVFFPMQFRLLPDALQKVDNVMAIS